jgi:predicted GIY-YIG superfamily endonuclease
MNEHKRWSTQTVKYQLWEFELLWYFVKNSKEEAQRLEKIIKKDWHISHWLNHETFVKNI